MVRNLVRTCADASARMLSSRTNYWAEFGIDLVLATVLIVEGLRYRSGPLWLVFVAIPLGFFIFSFIEYFFHRWMFHSHIPLFEHGHRMHHEQPTGYDSLPFFLPGMVALGLTALCILVMPVGFACLMMGAATVGYLVYVMSHFIVHHIRFRQPLLMRWAAFHHIHHHHPDKNFGVTTPLWDIILGTRYVRRSTKT